MASKLTQKVSHGVEELRDRAAETISADGESVFRAIKHLSDRIDEAEESIQSRLIDAESHLAEDLDDLSSERRRTTWPRRFFWLLVGAGIVTSVFVSAPERAKELRNRLQG